MLFSDESTQEMYYSSSFVSSFVCLLAECWEPFCNGVIIFDVALIVLSLHSYLKFHTSFSFYLLDSDFSLIFTLY